MTPEQKIAKVLKQIKNEAAINPNPRLMKFDLNNHIVGAGILNDDEKRRILLKLQKEGVIDMRLLQYKNTEPKEITVISSYEGERFMQSSYYWVEMLSGFDEKYEEYSKHLQPKSSTQKVKTEIGQRRPTAPPFTVHGDFVAGDKIGRNKNISPKTTRLNKYWWGLLIPVLVTVGAYIINEGKLPGLLNIPKTPSIGKYSTVATSTPNLSDLFSKALSYELVAERQDFLGKYIGKQVYGRGVIEEVSRAGDKFLIDIDLGKASIVCPQEKTDFLEEQYPFLKGRQVMLYGSFTYTKIFGHGDNISIEPCSFELN